MPLMPGAEPLAIDSTHPEYGRVGVLLLHGFTGSPKSMKPWGQYLADAGYTVRVPRLPGHGTRWQEMNITTWQDWYAEADRSLRELNTLCDTVFVMGLSMGGSLTLRLAEAKGDEIAGIVLVNAAVHSQRPDRFILPLVKHLVSAFPGISNDIKKPDQDEGAYDKIPLKAAHSLTKLWAKVKTDIAKVTQPTLLFRSAEDHVVEASNAAWILANVNSEDVTEVVLLNSFHVATLDNDAPEIFSRSLQFLRGHTTSEGA
ncbi:MAG: alpha/beta fold hydrolase [Candidatus Nanopelagicales bacterium]|jgi:carboxylesterase|nr:alpha/beta fold hydrolase [Candidatus Nanopelagicales bacterium]MDP4824330.1 alpha/beta fold hydrolase [Candidatus Nanopelagicales bacterium]MDP4889002.1 alpha/beta fold hydrolase [Candidatus Nanopelagicales bacterium]